MMPSFTSLRPHWQLLLPAFVGALAFFAISGGGILDPGNIGWLMAGDPGQHYIGWQFFRNTPLFQSPMGATRDFGMEIGSSIVYTDSLPIFAFLFKPFRGLLPDTFQYMGIWMLLCFILQSVLAWKLIGKFSSNTWVKLFGAGFFAIAPPFLLRMHGHEALMGHWLILAAFLLYFSDRWHPARWLALLLFASLVHAYMLLMVTAIWAADLATRFLARQMPPRQLGIWAAGSLAALYPVMWQAGYFMLNSTAVQGGGYGYYRMNMVSLFHANGGWSAFMADNFLGGGDDEGFNFLGIGGLVLFIIAIGEMLRDSSIGNGFRRIWPLAAVALALTLYALSNHLAFGATQLITVPLPGFVDRAASVFRASGRVFWPVFYLIYLGAMFVVAKTFRPRMAAVLFGSLLAIQVADCTPALKILHKKLVEAKPWVSSLQSPFWREAARKYKRILYVPPHNVPRNYLDLANYAAMNHMAINIGAFARVDQERQLAAANALLHNVDSGAFDPDSLYIFEQGTHWTTALAALHPGDQAGAVDGFRILAPQWAQCTPCVATGALAPAGSIDRVLKYNLGTLIGFTELGNSLDYTVDGFSRPEPWGTWTEGKVAHIAFRLTEAPQSDLTLSIGSYAYIGDRHPQQDAVVLVNGHDVGTISFLQSGAVETRLLHVPKDVVRGDNGEVTIEFKLPNAISPSELGEPTDNRHLALGFVWMNLKAAK